MVWFKPAYVIGLLGLALSADAIKNHERLRTSVKLRQAPIPAATSAPVAPAANPSTAPTTAPTVAATQDPLSGPTVIPSDSGLQPSSGKLSDALQASMDADAELRKKEKQEAEEEAMTVPDEVILKDPHAYLAGKRQEAELSAAVQFKALQRKMELKMAELEQEKHVSSQTAERENARIKSVQESAEIDQHNLEEEYHELEQAEMSKTEQERQVLKDRIASLQQQIAALNQRNLREQRDAGMQFDILDRQADGRLEEAVFQVKREIARIEELIRQKKDEVANYKRMAEVTQDADRKKEVLDAAAQSQAELDTTLAEQLKAAQINLAGISAQGTHEDIQRRQDRTVKLSVLKSNGIAEVGRLEGEKGRFQRELNSLEERLQTKKDDLLSELDHRRTEVRINEEHELGQAQGNIDQAEKKAAVAQRRIDHLKRVFVREKARIAQSVANVVARAREQIKQSEERAARKAQLDAMIKKRPADFNTFDAQETLMAKPQAPATASL